MCIHIHVCTHIGHFPTKLPLKIPLRFNRYNFQTVKAIDFFFSTLHTTPFLYGEICFGVLQCEIPHYVQTRQIPFGSPVIKSLLKFGLWVEGRKVPLPIVANCVPLYQVGKCACRDLSIYKPNLKRFDYSYQKLW